MSDNTPNNYFHYQPDPIIKPGANLTVWVWLVLLGLPALLLFLIYAKSEDLLTGPAKQPAAIMQPAEHH